MKIFKILILIILLTNLAFAQSDSATKQGEWKWYVLEDFETGTKWPIVNRLHSLKEWTKKNPIISLMKGGPKNVNYEKKETCLGIKIKMDNMGDTRKFVIPLRKIDVPGICQKISFWVNSRNKPLTLKIVVQDYMNYIHVLEPDPFTLDYWGWKKFEVSNVDKLIEQLSSVEPDYRPLKILGFVIENPLKKIFYKPVYVYIDQLETFCRVDTLTDFDGSEIRDVW